MKHFSTPAWSLGGRFKETEKFLPPQPGTYEVRTDPLDIASSKFGKGNRAELVNPNSYPGPGAYEIPAGIKGKSRNSKSSKSNRKEAPRDKNSKSKIDTPGPGAYNPNPVRTSTNYSFGNKAYALTDQVPNLAPGPGMYEPVVASNTRNWKFGNSDRAPIYDASGTVPGPGQYDGDKVTPAPPKYGIGTGPRQVRTASEGVPGPGTYEAPNVKTTMSKTITGRRPMTEAPSITKGPGAYTPNPIDKAPSFSIGKGHRSNFAASRDCPGPGGYDPKLVAVVSKSTKFGTGRRPPINSTVGGPGPGAYEYNTVIGKGAAITMVGRKAEEKKLTNVPVRAM
jgi:hypothetical protein